MLQCFKSKFQTIKAHAWMNDAHVYEMQVQLCKPNTVGVIAVLYPIRQVIHTPIKVTSNKLENVLILS